MPASINQYGNYHLLIVPVICAFIVFNLPLTKFFISKKASIDKWSLCKSSMCTEYNRELCFKCFSVYSSSRGHEPEDCQSQVSPTVCRHLSSEVFKTIISCLHASYGDLVGKSDCRLTLNTWKAWDISSTAHDSWCSLMCFSVLLIRWAGYSTQLFHMR